MALGAIVAGALNAGIVPNSLALWVGGHDMVFQTKSSANAYGVPIETIKLSLAGPGSVSSLEFSIEDPAGVVGIPVSATEVVLYDLAHDHPEFGGFLTTVRVRRHENGTGRWLDCHCDGYEVLLDWVVVPPTTTTLTTLAQAWARACEGSGIRVQYDGVGNCTTSAHVGQVGGLSPNTGTYGPMTLREYIYAVWPGQQYPVGDGVLYVTVDARKNLCVFTDPFEGVTGVYRQDCTIGSISVSDTVAGTTQAEELSYGIELGDVVRQVYVVGSGGTSYGWFYDGTGKPGPSAYINDSTITSASLAYYSAMPYIKSRAGTVRGGLTLSAWSPGSMDVQPGYYVNVSDAVLGLGGSYRVGGVSKQYLPGGLETWTFELGSPRPSAVRMIRRLTRGVLS